MEVFIKVMNGLSAVNAKEDKGFLCVCLLYYISTIFANLKMEGKDTDPLIQGSFALMKPCWLYAVFKCHNQALFSSTQLAKHLSPILIQVLSVSLYIACMFVYIRQTSFVCSCSIKSEEIPSPLMRSSRILFFKIFLRRTRSLSRLHLSTCLRLFCF